jgi:hypothetical protein
MLYCIFSESEIPTFSLVGVSEIPTSPGVPHHETAESEIPTTHHDPMPGHFESEIPTVPQQPTSLNRTSVSPRNGHPAHDLASIGGSGLVATVNPMETISSGLCPLT